MAKSLAKNSLVITLALLLLGVASWTLHSMLRQGVTDVLLNLGIENFYVQGAVIIIVVLVLLVLLGFKSKKIIKKIMD